MARSYRHTPISGITTAHTEKDDKRRANRKLRRITRQILPTHVQNDALILPALRDVSNPYNMAKDDKHWMGLGRHYWFWGPEDLQRLLRK